MIPKSWNRFSEKITSLEHVPVELTHDLRVVTK